jgi:hypothetical protein
VYQQISVVGATNGEDGQGVGWRKPLSTTVPIASRCGHLASVQEALRNDASYNGAAMVHGEPLLLDMRRLADAGAAEAVGCKI